MPEKSKAVQDGGAPIQARPFLKWVGGKRQLLDALLKKLPEDINDYHEPFLGGGAFFWELAFKEKFKKAHLSDLNAELINSYSMVKNYCEELIASLKKHVHEEEYYYDLRGKILKSDKHIERASRLIYLNKTCYNGLYRVNSKGQFNVPFGSYKNPKICDEDNLRLCAQALKNVSIRRRGFATVLNVAKPKDLVYFDPPYHPVSKTSNFSAYEKSGFGELEQQHLKEVFEKLVQRGCYVMLSNSYSDFTKELFKDYNIETVRATRSVNSKSSARGAIKEIIVRKY